MNKLDYLAQKEEELRRLNEQLDQRKILTEDPKHDPLADSLDMRRTSSKLGNPFEQPAEEEKFRSSTTSLLKEAKNLRESYESEEQPVAADHSEIHELIEKLREQEKTINFQKAKIVALQAELEDTIKSSGKLDSKFEDLDKLNQKITEENKKLLEKFNGANLSQQKLKTQNTDLLSRISQLEKTVADMNKDLDAGERDKRKAF